LKTLDEEGQQELFGKLTAILPLDPVPDDGEDDDEDDDEDEDPAPVIPSPYFTLHLFQSSKPLRETAKDSEISCDGITPLPFTEWMLIVRPKEMGGWEKRTQGKGGFRKKPSKYPSLPPKGYGLYELAFSSSETPKTRVCFYAGVSEDIYDRLLNKYAANGSSQAQFIDEAINREFFLWCRWIKIAEIVPLTIAKALWTRETELLGRFDYAFNTDKTGRTTYRHLFIEQLQ